jgi:hypothetical protein
MGHFKLERDSPNFFLHVALIFYMSYQIHCHVMWFVDNAVIVVSINKLQPLSCDCIQGYSQSFCTVTMNVCMLSMDSVQ